MTYATFRPENSRQNDAVAVDLQLKNNHLGYVDLLLLATLLFGRSNNDLLDNKSNQR